MAYISGMGHIWNCCHTKNMCDDYRSQQVKSNMKKQNALEKEKPPEIKIDKGFSM